MRPEPLEIDDVSGKFPVKLVHMHSRSPSIGVAQPVHVARLIPADLCALEQPLSTGPLRLAIFRAGRWFAGALVAQNADGTVQFKNDADNDVELLELANEEFKLLYDTEAASPE